MGHLGVLGSGNYRSRAGVIAGLPDTPCPSEAGHLGVRESWTAGVGRVKRRSSLATPPSRLPLRGPRRGGAYVSNGQRFPAGEF